jgi:hypothetical protein
MLAPKMTSELPQRYFPFDIDYRSSDQRSITHIMFQSVYLTPLSHAGDFDFCHHVIIDIVSKPLQSALFLDVERCPSELGRDLTRVRHDAMGFTHSPSGSSLPLRYR